MIRIQLIGKFEVFDANGVPLKLRSHRRLYAYLALARGKPIPRRLLHFSIWPDVPTETAQNRLRVSMSSLRKSFGVTVIESPDGLAFAPGAVTTDLETLHSELMDIENEVDEDRERARLEALLPLLSRELLADMDEPFIDEYRLHWVQTALQTLERLSTLAWKTNDYRLASRVAAASFTHDPYNDKNWLAYLKAKVRLGESADAMKEFAVSRAKYQADSETDFSEELLEFAKQIRLGQYTFETAQEGSMGQSEVNFISHLFEVYYEKDPQVVAQFLGNKNYLQEQLKFNKASRTLLSRMLPLLERGTLPWIRVHLAHIEAIGILNESEEVLKMWDEVRNCEIPSDLRSIYLNMTSFARFSMRDYAGALEDINEAIRLSQDDLGAAERHNTNKASYLWHLGEFEESDRLYERSSVSCRQKTGDFYVTREAVNHVNQGFSRIMQGKLEESLPFLEKSLVVLQKQRQEAGLAMALPAIGYVRFAVLGDKSALFLMCRGIKLSYHLRFERSQQIALDYLAAAFAHAGDYEMARTVIEYCDAWRQRTNHDYSVAEKMLRDRTLEKCGVAPGTESSLLNLPVPDALCVIVKRLRDLATTDEP